MNRELEIIQSLGTLNLTIPQKIEMLKEYAKEKANDFGNFLKAYHSKKAADDILYWCDNWTGNKYFTTEQLYEQYELDKLQGQDAG